MFEITLERLDPLPKGGSPFWVGVPLVGEVLPLRNGVGDPPDAVSALYEIWRHFEEPFEGPEPDELELTLQESAVWTRSRTTFRCDDCTAETPFEVEVTTGPDAGETTTFAATAGVNGFGSGTKKSTNTGLSQTPQLQ